jgi:1-acyl-sn-glycerol-3-phosphate acyltransferase
MPLFKGSVCTLAVVIVSITATLPMIILAMIKFSVPSGHIKNACTEMANLVARGWVSINRGVYFFVHRPQWRVSGLDNLSPDQWYLIISNHQSWTDIAILVFLISERTSPLKFFLKQELIWLPFVGIACWVLDFPFMKRHSREAVEANPELRAQDLERTRQFCNKLRQRPASIINYVEGTRFTPAKQKLQASPYRHLLQPKTGGMAYVIASMGSQLQALIDATIVYKGARRDFFGFLSGQIDPVVDIKARAIPSTILAGDYQQSEQFRVEFKAWVAQLWREKDALVQKIIDEN